MSPTYKIWYFLMKIKSSFVISLQVSAESVPMDGFIYNSVCACTYMFAICTHIQMHMSTCAIFICFVNCLEAWTNKTSSWLQNICTMSKVQNFCLEFQQTETLCKSDVILFHKWGNLCFMKKLHTWSMYDSSTHIFCSWAHRSFKGITESQQCLFRQSSFQLSCQ